MKIYFSHGKESGPWGTKIKKLAKISKQHNFEVESIDYSKIKNPDERVQYLLKSLENEKGDFILVGSSMGGYVSLLASEQEKVKGVFLLAPALFLSGYNVQEYNSPAVPVEIIHGWGDTVVPFENSVQFAKNTNCSLHLIEGDHRLNSSLDKVSAIFEQFLKAVLSGN